MILPRRTRSGPEDAFLRAPLATPCFAVLWTTGPDTTLDGVVRILARKKTSAGGWESFDRWCDPHAGGARVLPGEDGWRARFGRSAEELRGESASPAAWRAFAEFAGDGPLVVADVAGFRAWSAHLAHAKTSSPPATGLSDVAALLFPGRLAQRREELLAALVEPTAGEGTDCYGPEDLRLALDELARRFLEVPEDVQRVAVHGFRRAWTALGGTDERACLAIDLALSLVDRRAEWSPSAKDAARLDGRLQALLAPEVPLEDLLETLQPRCARELERWRELEQLPGEKEDKTPFDPADLELLDRVFDEHLPALLAPPGGAPSYRKSQHEVARAVAGALGTGELLLVHAPTGTGKTLAYLVPAMLWSRRRGVRIGIATYTRALQEQAMDREVPRALAALSRAGVAPGTRVSVLKGRDNYVCWRALKLAQPGDDEDGETWLAWTVLALFALTDLDADLDRLPLSPPVAVADGKRYLRVLQAILRHSRSEIGCCTQREDRQTCGAEVARARALKSHVVIVNQAFALARQEFFRHVVFDECEHLHDQAHNAWSHAVSLRETKGVLRQLSNDDGDRSRALLDRLQRSLLEGTPSYECVERCVAAHAAAREAVEGLEHAVDAFDDWRRAEHGRREDRDAHSFLREYACAEIGGPLIEARCTFTSAWSALETQLAELAERIDAMPLRGMPRMRRTLSRARTDLGEALVSVEAWLPLEQDDEGAPVRPSFRPQTFYDVERDLRGELVLSSRVLLPNEFLGRSYYPQLATGVFVSATTVLQDGFEASMGYLGLDRAAKPAVDEDREPRTVRTFRAPEVFDYSRVLVCVPRDAPSAGGDKDAFLDYVRRFVGHLGERTRGRMLVLFTNAADTVRVGEELAGFFRARSIPLWFQNMQGRAKEELGDLFRARVDSVLLGVDTFWYGADFPGDTLQYLVIVKLPYGVPDRYHHAQCAVLSAGEQRRRIYLPRALAKFRQGFGRLMRREEDRGCVFVLDGRVLEPKHRAFLRELPTERPFELPPASEKGLRRARLVRGDTERCLQAAFEHMGLRDDVERRGLASPFASGDGRDAHELLAGRDAPLDDAPSDGALELPRDDATNAGRARDDAKRREAPSPLHIPFEDLPF